MIELKTEAGSHRADQLPYYLLLAAAAHPGCGVDLTYITGPLSKPAPLLGDGQRYSHLEWAKVLPRVEAVWGADHRREVIAYVDAVRTVIQNLTRLHPSEQRDALLGHEPGSRPSRPSVEGPAVSTGSEVEAAFLARQETNAVPVAVDLLGLARATASDGQQRGVGATNPSELERLRDTARSLIGALPVDDATRFVLPWLWRAGRTDGRGLTPEGSEFGYELRFSRFTTVQIKP